MTEMEDAWELVLAEAMQRAQAAGRADLTGYLNLRARNDLLRRTATDWLTITFTALAAVANRHGAAIQIEQKDGHRFHRGSATMVGCRLILRCGVRTLTIESGWPRAPRDGIVRGDGLACANIKHLGRPRSNSELLLARTAKGATQWQVMNTDGEKTLLSDEHLRDHFSLLLAD